MLKRKEKDAEEKPFIEGEEKFKIGKMGWVCSSIPSPFNEVANVVVRYITLEGHFSNFPLHHMVLLNHFRHTLKVNLSYYILHSLETYIVDVQAHLRGLPLHQGVIFLLKQYFHDAVSIPPSHPLYPPPTQQHRVMTKNPSFRSPSPTPPLAKRVLRSNEKGIHIVIAESFLKISQAI